MHDFPTAWDCKPTGKVRFSVGHFGRLITEIEVLETVAHPGTFSPLKRGDTRLRWERATKYDTDYLIRLGVMTKEQE